MSETTTSSSSPPGRRRDPADPPIRVRGLVKRYDDVVAVDDLDLEVAAAEVVVGLAIIMSTFRTRRSASVDDANLLKY